MLTCSRTVLTFSISTTHIAPLSPILFESIIHGTIPDILMFRYFSE